MFNSIYDLNIDILYFLNGLPEAFHIAAVIIGWSVYLMIPIVLYRAYIENNNKGIKVPVSVGLAYITSEIIKSFTHIPRPYTSLEGLFVIQNSTGPSFPSSHTTVAFTLSETKPYYTNFFRFWAIMIGISRIILAQHYPTDIITGALLGVLISNTIVHLNAGPVLEKIQKNIFEIKRQIVHLMAGSLVAIGIYLSEKTITAVSLLCIAITGYVLSDIAKSRRIPFIDWFLDRFERKNDLKKFPGKGAFFFIAGSLATVLLYERNIAFIAVLVLAVGDAATTIGGSLFGSTRLLHSQNKTLEGTTFGLITVFLTLIIVTDFSYLNSLVVAVIFGITESISLKIRTLEIDDNLIIPVICGLVISLMV